MWAKANVQHVVDHYLPIFQKLLDLEDWNINVIILNSRSKQFRQMDYPKAKWAKAWSTSSPNIRESEILIFYDRCDGREDCVGTVIHELIHILYADSDYICKDRTNLYNNFEEHLVQRIEKLVLAILPSCTIL